ncbi:MAG: vitamin B12-dependent ribonucleotide reductase, partial [Myxococcota bacterium]|nr:vitamin B12-dependent ribonucleotide reductase [Myxococcota bacterium]
MDTTTHRVEDRKAERRPKAGSARASRAARPKAAAKRRGVVVPRYFSDGERHPFDTVEWELRSATITNERGEVIFEQTDVEIPKSWSQLATNVVVSKYFRGHLGTPERERSVKQLVGRVVDRIRGWG